MVSSKSTALPLAGTAVFWPLISGVGMGLTPLLRGELCTSMISMSPKPRGPKAALSTCHS